MYLKISRAGFRFGYIDEDLVVVEIRPDSNTQWETQWIIKKNTVEMFENLFASMKESERKNFQMDKILKKHRIKLAVAYLIAGKKKDFINTVQGIFSWMLPANYLVYLVPHFLLKKLLINLWVWKQKSSLYSPGEYRERIGRR